MKILPNGIAVLDDGRDSLLSRWVERDNNLSSYDKRIEDIFCKLIPLGGFVIDGGAYIGDHTVSYANAVGSKGKVYAFEPSLEAFMCLQHNTKHLPQVRCYNLALGDKIRKIEIITITHNQGANFIYESEKGSQSTLILDSLMFPKLDYIKLDLEGFELKALKGGYKTIKKHRPVVVVEVGSQLGRYNNSTNEVIKFFEDLEYRMESLPQERKGDTVFDVLFKPTKKGIGVTL